METEIVKLTIPVSHRDHIQGKDTAPLTLVEYGDYECPYCGQAHPIIKQVQKHFGLKLRFVFRNFPVSQIRLLGFGNSWKHLGPLLRKLDDFRRWICTIVLATMECQKRFQAKSGLSKTAEGIIR